MHLLLQGSIYFGSNCFDINFVCCQCSLPSLNYKLGFLFGVWIAFNDIRFTLFQGYFTTKVLLGCPAGQKVVFDSVATKKRGAVHYCDQDHSDVPCFHFDRGMIMK